MRIVNRATFLSLPAGTIFAKVVMGALDFEALAIKDETVVGVDWYEQRLIGDFQGTHDSGEWADTFQRLLSSDTETAKPDFDILCRDGLFDEDQMFAVFDQQDAQHLVERLQRAVRDAAK